MTFQERQKINYSDAECFQMIKGGVVSQRVFTQALAQNYELALRCIKNLQQKLPTHYPTINHFEKTLENIGIKLH